MGPFPTAARQLKFLVVGIDYITKWVEVEALATITEKNIRSFIWRNIICRYGIPRVLISDNGKQFDNKPFSKAVIPVEVRLTTYRVENHDENKDDKTMRLHLDLVVKVRATTEQRLARYQNLMANHYNSKIKHKDFQVGDLVLRRVIRAARDAS
ncbi:uncharacterized protein LOC142625195 [Castanea sativa]|uniref:uncharacterized protein LOC142625195 n=1 Tax=Castanea sativa TaxID=21020 RepID=UPI003F64BA25